MRVPLYPICLLILIGLTASCASDRIDSLESARFALDAGDFGTAIEKATDALADDPDNVEAARILSSAYFGRSGIDFLDLAEVILDLDTSSDDNFRTVGNALPSDGDLDDLRLAITTIEALDGVDDADIADEELADAVFDISMMQMVEHYAIGVYQSGFHTSLDVTDITDAGADIVVDDLIAFDSRAVGSGVASDKDFLSAVRQTFCILEPISAGEGFTTAEYQALVGCQLSDSPATFDTAALTADIANCAALDPNGQGADVEACYDADTSL